MMNFVLLIQLLIVEIGYVKTACAYMHRFENMIYNIQILY